MNHNFLLLDPQTICRVCHSRFYRMKEYGYNYRYYNYQSRNHKWDTGKARIRRKYF